MDLTHQPDPLWRTVLAKIQELQDKGYAMSSRGVAMYGSEKNSCSCLYKAYTEKDLEQGTRSVFLVEAWYSSGIMKAKVEGPFEDSGDEFWATLRACDNGSQNWIVTPEWVHYTVHKDSESPGQGDGYGGSLFTFQIESPTVTARLTEAGLKVVQQEAKEGHQVFWHLMSRNTWFQGIIPPRHRHLWTPNAKLLTTL